MVGSESLVYIAATAMCKVLQSLVRACVSCIFFFQAEDGIRDLVRSRGLGDVYKRQVLNEFCGREACSRAFILPACAQKEVRRQVSASPACLLYTSDAADERSSVDLGGRRIIKKKTTHDS